ncbi:hypothetical protein [Streptomyces durhamensis]|uniref:hypothetical protein n=1 Tax=Streptomyces durhamensis TaxID=68194 RepID=UPI0012FEBB16|nr:hypothetical protein [Streptomyces durhamensis]
MAVAAPAYGDAVLTVFERGFVEPGQHHRQPLGRGWNPRFERADPVREFRWSKGGESSAGLYYTVTVGGHVGSEPWLEQDRLILLDQDPEAVGTAARPFWLHRHDGMRRRRHAQDDDVRLSGAGPVAGSTGRPAVRNGRGGVQSELVDQAAVTTNKPTEEANRA